MSFGNVRSAGAPGRRAITPVRSAALLTILLLLAWGCDSRVKGPGAGQAASLAVEAEVAAQQQGDGSGGPAAAFSRADTAEVRVLQRSGGSVLAERTVAFEPSSGTTTLDLEVRLPESRVGARVQLRLSRGADPLFEGSERVTLQTGETVTVELSLEPVVEGVSVPDGPVRFTAIGDSTELSATASFATGDTIPGAETTWSGGDPEVAEVRSDGTVVARGPGETAARATVEEVSASVGVVVDPEVAAVTVRPDSVKFESSSADTVFTASVADANGNPVPDAPVTWSSTDSSVATVDSTGRAVAQGDGTAGVVATAMGVSDTATVVVASRPTGRLSGRVTDGKSDAGVGGVEVRFFPTNDTSSAAVAGDGVATDRVVGQVSPAATTTTDAEGRWTSPPLSPGGYGVEFARDGRVNTTLFGANVTEDVTTPVASVPLAPEGGSGTISGTLQNARTLDPVPSATVELRFGVNNLEGEVLATATSDSSGRFTIEEQLAGTYTLLARAEGFAEGSRTTVVVGGESTTAQDLNLSPTGSGQGEMQVVLTWGETPSDLDAHMRGPLPGSTDRFHVYFGNMGSLTSSPFTALDVDDITSFGPETVTVGSFADGTYRYVVHDFTNSEATPDSPSNALANSGARVEVFRDGAKVGEFFPPSQDGTEWTVFEVEVADGSVVEMRTIGTMDYEQNSSEVGSTSATAGVQAGAQEASGGKPYDDDRHRTPR